MEIDLSDNYKMVIARSDENAVTQQEAVTAIQTLISSQDKQAIFSQPDTKELRLEIALDKNLTQPMFEGVLYPPDAYLISITKSDDGLLDLPELRRLLQAYLDSFSLRVFPFNITKDVSNQRSSRSRVYTHITREGDLCRVLDANESGRIVAIALADFPRYGYEIVLNYNVADLTMLSKSKAIDY